MKIASLLLVGSFFLLLGACGSERDNETSKVNYVSWGAGSARQATLADVRKKTLIICVRGTLNPQDSNKALSWSMKATLTWLRALAVIDKTVTNNVKISCEKPDLTLHMVPGRGTSYAYLSSAYIYVGEPFGTWTHELGHALAAIGDTYYGGAAGYCQSGQPASLMCWGGYGPRSDDKVWSGLWPDDIKAIRANFKSLFGANTVAPDWAADVNVEKAFDSAAPWPDFGVDETPGVSHDLEFSDKVERLGSLAPGKSNAL